MSSELPSDSFFEPVPAKAARSNSTIWIVLIVLVAFLFLSCFVIAVLTALLLPAVQQAREAARRTQSMNNLKVVGLAAHNFHDAVGRFPPMAGDGTDLPEVTSPISFNTALLPYMDQAALYGTIDKSVPWNDAANQPAYSTVVPGWLAPHFEVKTHTTTGLGATHYVANSQMILEDGGGIRLTDVTDGLSNTVLAGSIDDSAIPAWGDPANHRDVANGFAGGPNAYGGVSGGALVLMADGSVRFVSNTTNPTVAAAIASPNGGEVTPEF